MDVEFSERIDLDVMTAGPWMQIRPWMSHGCSAYTRHVIMVGPKLLCSQHELLFQDQSIGVIVVGPWMLCSQNGFLDPGRHHGWALV